MSDYYSIVQRMQQTSSQIANLRAEQKNVEEKIRQLTNAYKILAGKKDQLNAVRKKDKRIVNNKYKWKGDKYNGKSVSSFKQQGERLNDTLTAYYKELDKAHDSINREINRLERSRYGVINKLDFLGNALSKLRTELENKTN